MWEPVGPLPAAVYWRRRWVALASAVTLVGLAIATAGTPTGTPVPAANRVPVTATSTAAGQPAGTPPDRRPARARHAREQRRRGHG